MIYIVATSDVPIFYAVIGVAAMAVCTVAAIVLLVSSYGRPKVPPLQITTNGWLVLGRRRWPVRSLAEVQLWGHRLVFKNARGRTLFEVREFQTGDLEGFVHALKRQAPGVIVRASDVTMRPRHVRVPKDS